MGTHLSVDAPNINFKCKHAPAPANGFPPGMRVGDSSPRHMKISQDDARRISLSAMSEQRVAMMHSLLSYSAAISRRSHEQCGNPRFDKPL